MAKKRNLKDLDQETMDFIDSKMNNGVDERYGDTNYGNCSKALDYKINLKCKNKKQKEYHKLIKEKEVVFCSGEPGSGKSYVALATALELLKSDNNYKKLVIVVPIVQAESEVGFLKGTLEEKLAPYTECHIYNMEKILTSSGNNGKEVVRNLIKCGLIEFRCVSFMRGCTISDSILFVSEGQNLSKSAFKTILTRIGENSKYIFDGDISQIDERDIKKGKVECGLKYAVDKLKDLEDVGTIEFGREDIVRNPIITKILDNWDAPSDTPF